MTRTLLLAAVSIAMSLSTAAQAENFNAGGPDQQKLKVATVSSFDYGRIYVHTDERTDLHRIANLWRQRRGERGREGWATITVEGNGYVADDEEASIALGEARAQRVRNLLIKYGVNPKFIVAIGNSRNEPGRYVDVIVDTCQNCRR